jgi:coenzyme PQQ precursor peptide PqqA
MLRRSVRIRPDLMKIMRRESAICAGRTRGRSGQSILKFDAAPPDPRTASKLLRRNAMWTKPEFTEMRFGFEVTMYIYNR